MRGAALMLMVALSLAQACGGDDISGRDAGPGDSGAFDAGSPGLDSGPADSGPTDSGRPSDAEVDDGWQELIVDETLPGVALLGTTMDEITVLDGTLTCGTGPTGYWYTEAVYGDYELELEYRFRRPPGLAPADDELFDGNSGYLIHITGAHRVWPACIEVQGLNQAVGRIFAIGGAPGVIATEDAAARLAARNPVGDWNHVRIVSSAGALSVELNGAPVASSEASDLRAGQIGFQCEGAEISWRNVRIRPTTP